MFDLRVQLCHHNSKFQFSTLFNLDAHKTPIWGLGSTLVQSWPYIAKTYQIILNILKTYQIILNIITYGNKYHWFVNMSVIKYFIRKVTHVSMS